MSVSEARDLVPHVLSRKYGKRFRKRSGRLRRSCYRITTAKVRCRVSWNYKQYRYFGNVTLWADNEDDTEYLFKMRITRGLR